jgi:hypothetical protein
MNSEDNSFLCYVDGVHHYIIDEDYPSINDTVILIPEPNNEFDKNCIAVYTSDLKKIGNIPKRANLYVGDKINFKPAFAKVKYEYNPVNSVMIEILFK